MTLEEKQALYDDYFSLDSAVKLNISPFPVESRIPDLNEFIDEMPAPFRLASDITAIDAASVRQLKSLSHQADEIAHFLTLQSRKIDMIMSYLISEEDQAEERIYSKRFGAGGVVVNIANNELVLGQVVRMKLFLTQEAAAVYCYAEVLALTELPDNSADVKFVFVQIRENDRETLIRCALHIQSKQLRKLSEQRKKES
ncbi:PilZ domain-containing protein [Algibacillus agarilyticus]|uniref:PilZ domain-containing protein n=1 Tax=Algibacillus agarilyticus TaxID=2234133 RepID=UPI000DCF88EB|nr:PilZ domain-containing protein [Algibacillus agarilyticus]